MDLTIPLSIRVFFSFLFFLLLIHVLSSLGPIFPSHQVSPLQRALDPPVASHRWNFPPLDVMKIKLN